MKKLAILRPDGNPTPKGFYNSQEIGLAKGLTKQGFSVDVYVASSDKQQHEYTVASNNIGMVRVIEIPCFIIPEISHAIFPNLIKEFKKHDYDYIQVNESNELTCYWVARYAKNRGIPCVIYQGMYKPISGRIRAFAQKLFDQLFLPSFIANISYTFTKTNLANQYLSKKGFNNVYTLPVGLDTDVFNNTAEKNWRAIHNISEKEKILLYVGIFEERRNVRFLIDVASKLKLLGYSLLLAGSGPLLDEIVQIIKTSEFDKVILLGNVPQSDLKSLYEIADIFLLASEYEIYGMVVLESLYFGCPVISTNTAGPSDMIENGVNGFILESLDCDIWAKTIIENVGLFNRAEISKNIQENLTWDSIAKQYDTIISTV